MVIFVLRENEKPRDPGTFRMVQLKNLQYYFPGKSDDRYCPAENYGVLAVTDPCTTSPKCVPPSTRIFVLNFHVWVFHLLASEKIDLFPVSNC